MAPSKKTLFIAGGGLLAVVLGSYATVLLRDSLVRSKGGLAAKAAKTTQRTDAELEEALLRTCAGVLAGPRAGHEDEFAYCKQYEPLIEKARNAPRAELKCRLPLPKVDPGCEGELCDCRTGRKLVVDADLLAEPHAGAHKVGSVHKGETVAEVELWLRVEQWGEARVQAEAFETQELGLRAGDRLALTQYIGEGAWSVCLGDREQTIWTERDAETDPVLYEIVREPRRSSWARVRTAAGRSGYVPVGALETVDCG